MKAAPEGVMMSNEIDTFGANWFPSPHGYYNEIERNISVLDDGWAKAALGLRTGGTWRFGHDGSIRGQSLPQVKSSLQVWRDRFKAGNTLAILQAVQLCADENMPLPTWLACAFSEALREFLQPGGKYSLDDAFKSPGLPTNQKSEAAKKSKVASAKLDWQLGVELWKACWEDATSNKEITSIDALLDIVLIAKPWGVKKRKARQLVTMVDESQAEHLQKREKQPLARFLEKRRKQ